MNTKSTLCALLGLAVVTVCSTAWAFDRNLSGNWTTTSGDNWVIVHIGKKANFSTVSYDDETGRISFDFEGRVSDSTADDKFEYTGVGKVKRIRVAGKLCTINSNMMASGYVSGELGGRIIQMTSCKAVFSARCEGKSEPINTMLNCSGTWK